MKQMFEGLDDRVIDALEHFGLSWEVRSVAVSAISQCNSQVRTQEGTDGDWVEQLKKEVADGNSLNLICCDSNLVVVDGVHRAEVLFTANGSQPDAVDVIVILEPMNVLMRQQFQARCNKKREKNMTESELVVVVESSLDDGKSVSQISKDLGVTEGFVRRTKAQKIGREEMELVGGREIKSQEINKALSGPNSDITRNRVKQLMPHVELKRITQAEMAQAIREARKAPNEKTQIQIYDRLQKKVVQDKNKPQARKPKRNELTAWEMHKALSRVLNIPKHVARKHLDDEAVEKDLADVLKWTKQVLG